MKKVLFILIVVMSFSSNAQDTLEYNWVLADSFAIQEDDVWAVDELENVYVVQNSAINKFDSTGTLKFSQSIKSYGKLKQLVPINAMKLVHFSEDQQTLCYLDNTLTPTEDCIEMVDHNFINPKLISSSERSDLLWVYDNLNSRLVLLPLEEGAQQKQEIVNLKGVLGIEEVEQILEVQGVLYVIDPMRGVYLLDQYGSLIEFIPMKGVNFVDVNEISLIQHYLVDGGLMNRVKDPQTNEHSFIYTPLPKADIFEMREVNQSFYFRTPKNVYKYHIQITK